MAIGADKAAPRTAAVNAEVVRCKPRLLAFVGPAWSTAIQSNNDNETRQVPESVLRFFSRSGYQTPIFADISDVFSDRSTSDFIFIAKA